MVIIAMFASMVVLSLGDSFARELRAEAERLQTIVIAAADEAVYTTAELGVAMKSNGYLLVRFDTVSQSWVPFGSQAFKPHELPPTMQINWEIEGFSRRIVNAEGELEAIESDQSFVSFGGSGADTEKATFGLGEADLDLPSNGVAENSAGASLRAQPIFKITPQILLLSSGEMTAFSVEFTAADGVENAAAAELISDGFSRPEIKMIDPLGADSGRRRSEASDGELFDSELSRRDILGLQ